MSSLLKYLGPGFGGAVAVATLAYVAADQFVVDVPSVTRIHPADAAPVRAPAPEAPPAEAVVIEAAAGTGAEALAADPVPEPAPVQLAQATPSEPMEAASQGTPPPEHVAFSLGREALPEEVAAWDIDVRPDGQGLPPGSGDVWTGEEIFAERCAVCHGDFGEAVGRWPQLAGGQGTLTDDRPVKTVGSFWPYLSTVWDYVHRAMPFGNAGTLTDDEVYAVVAYLLYVNDVVTDEDFTLSNENFLDIRLPNENGFFDDDRAEAEYPAFSVEPCMENCKDGVKIAMRAAVLDVTPEETRARHLRQAVESAKMGVTAPVADPAQSPTPRISLEGGETPAPAPAPEPEAEVAAVDPVAEPAPEPAPDPALVEAGEKVFRKCQACHQVGDSAANKTGPMLNGVVGRPAASVEGFAYSTAAKAAAESGLVWTEDQLTAFLERPRSFLQGTKMSFNGLRSADEISSVIAYLKTFAP